MNLRTRLMLSFVVLAVSACPILAADTTVATSNDSLVNTGSGVSADSAPAVEVSVGVQDFCHDTEKTILTDCLENQNNAVSECDRRAHQAYDACIDKPTSVAKKDTDDLDLSSLQ